MKLLCLKRPSGFCLACLLPLAAQSAPPPNDGFTNAIPLRGLVVTTTGSNADASKETGEPNHAGNAGGRSVWWTWLAPASGTASITTSNSTFDTTLGVYLGSAVGSLSLVVSNDDNGSGGTWSRVQFPASAGTLYRVAVDGYSGVTGAITLNMAGPVAPSAVTLVATGAVWKYLDNGSDQGTAWSGPGFDDSAWTNGPAPLGYCLSTCYYSLVTILGYGGDPYNKFVTTYFRKSFAVTNKAQFTGLTLSLLRDDGALVYLNGQEVYRVNMPAGSITYTNLALDASNFPWETLPLPSAALAALQEGTNVVAVEIHQGTLTSSDLAMDLGLVAQLPPASNLPPVVALTSPADGANARAGNLSLAAEAHDDDGSIARVEFYQGATRLGEDTTHPYSLVWSNAGPGAYALRAVATDNAGASSTSAVVNVTVTANEPPTVALTSPTNGQSFTVPGNIPLAATASDSDGVARVEFFQGNVKLGEDPTAPYAFTWTNAVAGSHQLRAVATDTAGASATSAVVTITVTGNYPPTVSLTSPATNASFFAPATIAITAAAADYDGVVSKVEFFRGATRLGEVTAGPFTFTWSNAPVGNYVLTAVATDNGGLTATSAPVAIAVLDPSSAFGGLQFDGVDDYVTFGVAPGLNLTNFTLETWFKWTGGGSVGGSGQGGVNAIPLITKGRGESEAATLNCNYFFGIRPDGILAADFEQGPGGSQLGLNHPVTGMTPVTPNVWNHAAVTYNGTNWALYLNGNLEVTAFVGQPPAWDSIQHAALGSSLTSQGTPQGAFAGVLDEARIWNHARSATQIASNRFLQIPAAPGLVGRWGLDETSGYIASDSSGRGHHGILTNANNAPPPNAPVWTQGYPFAVRPSVALTNPADNAVFFTPTVIALGAEASDPDGTITAVEYFADATPLGQATASPFSLQWTNPAPGYYALRAVATDNTGLTATSAPVNIVVQNALVWLSSPTNGARFIAPDPIPLAAEASDAGGAVVRVEFFAGTPPVGEATSRPFTAVWTNAALGLHAVSAVAVNNGGIRHTSLPVTVIVTANQPPAVTLTAPTNNAWFYFPTNLTLAATASDSDGSVAKVEFFAGTTKVDEDPTRPYTAIWLNPALGAHTLTAVATDNRGLAATSAVVNVSILLNTPPTVSLVRPTNGAGYIAPANVTLEASASDPDGIARIEFFQGATRLGEALLAPYTYVWSGVPAGAYQVYAVATDRFGLAATSSVANISVTNNPPPLVSLVSPTNNAVFNAPVNITLDATATDENGISRVEFFANSSKVGEATQAPYSAAWASAPGGSHVLTAVATDGVGLRATSAPVNITVIAPQTATNLLFGFGSVWKYLDNGSDQGTAWTTRDFDDSAWLSGPAQLGYGDGDEATVVGYGPDANNKYITTYFRRAFVLTNAAIYNALNLRLLRDDGGVVYLNGIEVYRSPSMPQGVPIYYNTLATGSGENTIDLAAGLANTLVNGTNVVAVEIHQNAGSSSDVSFDFELAGVLYNSPPIVFVTHPTNNAVFTAPTNLTVTASATDPDGSVTLVEFFLGAQKLGEAAAPPWAVAWNNISFGGVYAVRAVATDNFGARSTSAVVQVTILGNYQPTVAITSPPDGAAYVVPTNVLLTASATDPDGTIVRVEYFANGNRLGEVGSAPYTFDWTNQFAGLVWLTAIATDNAGATATSAPVRVNFLDAPPAAVLISTGAVWGYFDTVTSELPGWTEVDFNDSGWVSGPAQLGYGDGDEATTVGYGPNPNNRYVSTYFRRGFDLVDPTIYKSLQARLLRDDGAVVYLNGVELFRDNMPPGPVAYNTLAAGTASDDGTVWFPFTGLNPGLLRPGRNVLAVSIHQAAVTSTDISFDFELIGNTTNARPTVAISSPSHDAVFTGPADLTITASASDSDGSVTNVAFYAGPARLRDDGTAPFGFTWPAVPLGTYQLRAVATDNLGDSATSAVVRVFVVASTAPTVDAFDPPPGAVSNLTQVTVFFSEPVNGVDAADLLINGRPAGRVAGSNEVYTFTFPQPEDGPVSLSWASGHGLVDRETPPKPFNGSAPGETASYVLTDTVPPTLAGLAPLPGATVPSLRRVEVTFSEPVGGVRAADLLVNGQPAQSVSGSLAGPYRFEFASPAAGVVLFSWATNHAIRDLAAARNAFAGGTWTVTLDPVVPETNVVLNEIMYHPASERVSEEFIELLNTGAEAINLTGWRLGGGIDFDFPPVTLPAGAYLVVAADLAAFQAKYPTVSNVVAGWSGRLSNREDDVRLRNALDQEVDHVHYATEGDWALRQRGPVDNSHRGWEWFAAHDGNAINTATGLNEGNRSLELMHPALPNDNGQNWAPSGPVNGTPGRANSTASANVAPLVYSVLHDPPVPRSTNVVSISARVVDEQPAGLTVQLFFRDHTASYYGGGTPPPFVSTNMVDDGEHNDGLAGDGVYGAQLPPSPAGTVIEFYVAATDASAQTRTWPAAARLQNGAFVQQANAQYQVDDENYPGAMPVFRLVLTGTERAELIGINRNSDAEMNATLITSDGVDTKLRHNCGVRIRGAGTRSRPTPSYRLNIPADRLWTGLSEINFNGQYIHGQLAGAIFSLKSGLPAAAARPVQLRVNGVNHAPAGTPPQGNGDGAGFGTCLLMEPIGGEWAALHFPDDPNGNVYRGSKYPWNANLDYLGTDPQTYLTAGYTKTSNQSENDWTDLLALTYALNDIGNPNYVSGVERNANVRLFMRYFAVCTVVDYMETSMCRGVGDDYAMYRGLKDPRFLLIPHDFDTTFGEGDSQGIQSPYNTLWPMLNPPTSEPAMRANYLWTFMRHPAFVPLYYAEVQRLLDTTYSPLEMSRTLDEALTGWVPGEVIARMKGFVTNRHAYLQSQIPTNLTVSHGLGAPVNGYLRSTAPNVTLWGRANAGETRAVKVAGQPADWSAFNAAWTNTIALAPGINRVLVQAFNANNAEFERATLEVWYDSGAPIQVSGTLDEDTLWTAGGGPYQVVTTVVVPSWFTLLIEPGTTVYFNSGAGLTVNGRLLAEGTETRPIRFTRAPGSSARWGGLVINGNAGSPETRVAYAHFEFNGSTAIHSVGGTVFLDHLTFGATDRQYLSLDDSSFVVQDCHFPGTTASFEPVHGTGGIKSGGRGLFLRNFFGPITGYNDTIDFSGGHRPGPIVQFIGNVFMGSGDDNLDLANTDAWVEGNLFLHVHKNGSPDTASAISAGSDTGESSDVTIVGNLIYDCDHVALCKQGNLFTLLNNTVVRLTREGGGDDDSAVVCLADNNMAEGAGVYLEGNIIAEATKLVRNRTNALVTFTNNLMPLPWSGPGGGNSTADPRLRYVPEVAETSFTNWQQAQVLWEWFALQADSPARGAGPNGRDLGAVVAWASRPSGTGETPVSPVPAGASIAGEPVSPTRQTNVTLTVGTVRNGSGITPERWPDGAGYTHYQWRLNGGAWSAETPTATPITLTGLGNGAHTVEVVGRRDSGLWQNEPVLGPHALVTRSRTWVVNPNAPLVRLNEVLARNVSAVPVGAGYPDLVELYNPGAEPADLAGMSLTDNLSEPRKFVFPPGTSLNPGKYLVLFADNDTQPPGFHLGFALKAEGDDLYLFGADGRLLDSVSFGPQLADFSIGRLEEAVAGASGPGGTGETPGPGGQAGAWGLTTPTFGAGNAPVQMGSVRTLKINEWLAASASPRSADFIELFNPDPRPVRLGGLFLTDAPESVQGLSGLRTLSFIAGGGYLAFLADGNPADGPTHLDFRLAAEQGMIGLFDADLSLIDCVAYGSQTNNISQGRYPNGGPTFYYFTMPTPGAPNPPRLPLAGVRVVLNEVLAKNINGLTNLDGGTPEWLELYNTTATNVDLGGMSLSDTLAQPRKFVFPAGVVIPSGGYLVVLCDGDQPASTNAGAGLLNAGFGIKANGGTNAFFDRDATLLDYLVYGVQAKDFSVGRVPDGGTNWVLCEMTPGSVNIAAALGDPRQLRINEWLAGQAAGASPPMDADWIELFNPGLQPVALGGLYLTDDLRTPQSRQKHRIADLSFIGTGLYGYERFIADDSVGGEPDHLPFALRVSGESLGLYAPGDARIDAFDFPAQIAGVTEGRLPDGSTNIVRFPTTPTPADANYLPLTSVVINEVLSATPANLPLEDAIELHNASTAPVDLFGWWLSDARRSLKKFQITNHVVIPPGGYAVFYEYEFNANPDDARSFALDAVRGDEVYLSTATPAGELTGYRAVAEFGAAEPGVSFGRYTNRLGQVDFMALSARTFGMDAPDDLFEFRTGTGAANAYPKVGPIVFSEIMYHPPNLGGADNVRDEFLELYNPGTNAVPLFDPAHPENPWRLLDGVRFDFPTGLVIQPQGYLVVVSFDPVSDTNALAGFRAAYNLAGDTVLAGPYSGKLDNGGETLGLYKPGAPVPPGQRDAGTVPYILVERIQYDDVSPWDPLADGYGRSLHRVDPFEYGNDASNWRSGTPTPGPQPLLVDTDADGMPDYWEIQYGLDPNNSADRLLDRDGDGLLNWEEYAAGTDPTDPGSVLRVEQLVASPGNPARLVFQAVSNKTYTLQWKESLTAGQWTKLADVDGRSTNRLVTLVDPLPMAVSRLYRLVTPQRPGPTNPMPAILTSPQSVIAGVGDTVTFSVFAVGRGAVNYQWAVNGAPLPGANLPVLTLPNVQFGDAGDYTVTVTDAGGSLTSDPAELTLRPFLLLEPQSRTVPAGATVIFTNAAVGFGEVTYRWRRDGRMLLHETNAHLVLPNVRPGDAGEYSVVARHRCRGREVGTASSNALLNVIVASGGLETPVAQ